MENVNSNPTRNQIHNFGIDDEEEEEEYEEEEIDSRDEEDLSVTEDSSKIREEDYISSVNENEKNLKSTKIINLEKIFCDNKEIEERDEAFSEYEEFVFKSMKNEKDYIEARVEDIYNYFEKKPKEKGVTFSESDLNHVKKQLNLTDKTRVIKMMYLLTLIIFEMCETYANYFICAIKPYEELRNRYISKVIKTRLENTNIKIDCKTQKKDDGGTSDYYNKIYKSNLINKLDLDRKQGQNKEKKVITTIKNKGVLITSVKNESTDCHNEISSNNCKKVMEARSSFLHDLTNEDCQKVLLDTKDSIFFWEKVTRAAIQVFKFIIDEYTLYSEIEFEMKEIFEDKVTELIRKDPFYHVRFSTFYQFLEIF